MGLNQKFYPPQPIKGKKNGTVDYSYTIGADRSVKVNYRSPQVVHHCDGSDRYDNGGGRHRKGDGSQKRKKEQKNGEN